MRKLFNFCKKVTNLVAYVGIVAIAAMVLLVFVDVILRKVFTISIVGTTEMTQMLWICLVLGWGESVYGPDNLKIDVLMDALPKKAQTIIDILVTIFMMAVCLLIARQVFINAAATAQSKVTFSLLGVPEYPFIAIIAIAFIGGAIGLLGKAALYAAVAAGQDWAIEEVSHT